MTWRKAQVVVIGAVILLGIAGALILTQSRRSELSTLEKCFSRELPREGIDAACLKNTVTTLLSSHTTKEMMEFIVASSSPDTIKVACHQIAHIIGEETFIQSGSLEKTLSLCTNACNLGCIHGSIAADVAQELGETYIDEDIAHANTERIEQLGKKYCAKSSPLCHGMGHLLYLGTQDFPSALAACDRIVKSGSSQPCYQGVFMEGGGSGSSFGGAAPIKSKDYRYPCTSVDKQYQHACFVYLHDYQKRLFEEDTVPVEQRSQISRNACESFSEPTRAKCFFGFGFKMEQRAANVEYAAASCASLESADANACTVGLALYYASFEQTDNARMLCNSISDTNRSELCYNVLFQREAATGITGEIATSCKRIADTKCLAGYAHYTETKISLPDYRYYLSDS